MKNGLLTCRNKSRDNTNGRNNKVILYITAPKMNVIKNVGRTSFSASAFTADDMEIDNKGVLYVKVDRVKYSTFKIDNFGRFEISGSFSGGAMNYSNSGICCVKADFDVESMSYTNSGRSELTGKVKTAKMKFSNSGIADDKLDVDAESMSIIVNGRSEGDVNFKGQSMDITCSGIMEMKFDVDCDCFTSSNSGRLTLDVSGRADNTQFTGTGVSEIKSEGLNKF